MTSRELFRTISFGAPRRFRYAKVACAQFAVGKPQVSTALPKIGAKRLPPITPRNWLNNIPEEV